MKKGMMCKVTKTVSGGRPLVHLYKGDLVLLLKHHGAGYFKAYSARRQSNLSIHESLMEEA